MYKDHQCRLRGSQVHYQCQTVCQICGGSQWPGGTYWHRRRHESWVSKILVFLEFYWSFLIWSIGLTSTTDIWYFRSNWNHNNVFLLEDNNLSACSAGNIFDLILLKTSSVHYGLKPFTVGPDSPSFQGAWAVCFLCDCLHKYTQSSSRKCLLKGWSQLSVESIFYQFALQEILKFSF